MSDDVREGFEKFVCGKKMSEQEYLAAHVAYHAAQAEAVDLMRELVKTLSDSEQLLQDAQDIMRSNIVPNGISNKDAVAAYIALLDNVRQRRVQAATHQAITKAQAWLAERGAK